MKMEGRRDELRTAHLDLFQEEDLRMGKRELGISGLTLLPELPAAHCSPAEGSFRSWKFSGLPRSTFLLLCSRPSVL